MRSLIFASALLFLATPHRPVQRVTEPFRAEHLELEHHLRHAGQLTVRLLDGAPAAEQRQTMADVLSLLDAHILPHAEWEERVLYPAVDRRIGESRRPFSASLRHEHRIVARWTEDLKRAADRGDARTFGHRALQLMGLLAAHFECEDEVLLPILDQTMTPADFKREILEHPGPAGAGGRRAPR